MFIDLKPEPDWRLTLFNMSARAQTRLRTYVITPLLYCTILHLPPSSGGEVLSWVALIFVDVLQSTYDRIGCLKLPPPFQQMNI